MALPLKILCPIDCSDTSEHLLLKARDIAAGMRGELYLVHVVSSSPNAGFLQSTPPASDKHAKALRLARHNAKKQLYRLVQKYVPPGIRAYVIVRQGEAVNEIVDTAKVTRADFIIVPTVELAQELPNYFADKNSCFNPVPSCRILSLDCCGENDLTAQDDLNMSFLLSLRHPVANHFPGDRELPSLRLGSAARKLDLKDSH